jgi:hypothetical protein
MTAGPRFAPGRASRGVLGAGCLEWGLGAAGFAGGVLRAACLEAWSFLALTL